MVPNAASQAPEQLNGACLNPLGQDLDLKLVASLPSQQGFPWQLHIQALIGSGPFQLLTLTWSLFLALGPQLASSISDALNLHGESWD